MPVASDRRTPRGLAVMDDLTMGIEAWLWMGVWVLALFVTVWLLVREPRPSRRDDALDILRSRLARGEISRDEFEAARRLLENDARKELTR